MVMLRLKFLKGKTADKSAIVINVTATAGYVKHGTKALKE